MAVTWKRIAYKEEVLPDLLAPYAVGDLLYASAADALSKLADVATGNVLLSGGIGAAPAWGKVPMAAIADIATGTLLGRNTALAGIPEVITDIPTAITIGGAYVYRAGGTDIAVADGGTGLSAYAAGDILYASAEAALSKLAKADAGSVLLSGDLPSWGKVGLTTHISGVLAVANGGTGGADAWTTAQDPGHKHSKLWASDGDPEAVTVDAGGYVGIGCIPSYNLDVGGEGVSVTIRCNKFTIRDDNNNIAFSNNNVGAFLLYNVVGVPDTGAAYVFHVTTSLTAALTIYNNANVYMAADCSALSFTDRTPYFKGDALAVIKNIKGKKNTEGGYEIDHSTLPDIARKTIRRKVPISSIIEEGFLDMEEEGRDIGAMISILTVAIQQQQTQIEALQARL